MNFVTTIFAVLFMRNGIKYLTDREDYKAAANLLFPGKKAWRIALSLFLIGTVIMAIKFSTNTLV